MPVTPTGPLAVAVDALRTLISNVPYFQTWTGAANAAAALNSIFTGEVGFPILSVSIANGVCTVQTTEQHTIQVGGVIEIQGASLGAQTSEGSLDGVHTVTAVTSNTISFTTALPAEATVYPDHAMILPQTRPLAVVCEADDGLKSDVIGTGGACIYQGSIEVLLEADVSPAYQFDPVNALYEARNAYGQFVQGLAETQGTADLMCLNNVEPLRGPEFTRKEEQDNGGIRFERWRAVCKVSWGVYG